MPSSGCEYSSVIVNGHLFFKRQTGSKQHRERIATGIRPWTRHRSWKSIWTRKSLINFKLQIIGISSNFAHSRWSQHHNISLLRWTFPCNKNRAILRSFLFGQLFFGRVLTTAYSRQSESIQMNHVCCVRNKIICALPCQLGIPYLEYSMPLILRVRSVGKPSASKILKQKFLNMVHQSRHYIYVRVSTILFNIRALKAKYWLSGRSHKTHFQFVR